MNTQELPIWVQWLEALGPFAIAVAGAMIAFGQWRLAITKRNDDLFDKRYKLLVDIRKLFKSRWGDVESGELTVYDVMSNEELTEYHKYLSFKQSEILTRAAILFDSPFREKLGGKLTDKTDQSESKFQEIMALFQKEMS